MPNRAPGYQKFFAELKRRRVFRVMAVYGAVAFVVLQLADIVLPNLGLPAWTMNFILLLALVGFPFAVVLAWAFEVTPEGVRRTTDATPGEISEILAAPRAQRWPSGLLALAGITALLAGAWYIGRASASPEASPGAAPPGAGAAEASIAVLPFVNMSADPEQEYFSDGISEEVLNLLAKIPQLRVASRTSAFSYKGKEVRLDEVAHELGVAHVLEGSVRKSGDRVRITAQLIDARSDTHLWSHAWDRTLDDVFAVQDEIAADVVDALKVSLLGEAPHADSTDAEAYALYLQARQLGRLGSPEGFERSDERIEQALRIDSAYAPAWAQRATNFVTVAGQGWVPFETGYERAREAARRAIALDPDCAPAYAALGWIALSADGDLEAAARHFERALALAPGDVDILGGAAGLARNLGRLDQAIAFEEYAIARDPVNPMSQASLGIAYYYAGRWDDAIARFQAALDLSPERTGSWFLVTETMLARGDPAAALESIEREPDEGWRLLGLAMAYHGLGRGAESDAALAELIAKYEREMAYNIAYGLAYREEPDRAFAWLEKAVEYGDPGLADVAVEPLFANLRDDPRWLPFLESIGKSPGQMAAVEFEVALPR